SVFPGEPRPHGRSLVVAHAHVGRARGARRVVEPRCGQADGHRSAAGRAGFLRRWGPARRVRRRGRVQLRRDPAGTRHQPDGQGVRDHGARRHGLGAGRARRRAAARRDRVADDYLLQFRAAGVGRDGVVPARSLRVAEWAVRYALGSRMSASAGTRIAWAAALALFLYAGVPYALAGNLYLMSMRPAALTLGGIARGGGP